MINSRSLLCLTVALWILTGHSVRSDESTAQPEKSASASSSLNVFEGMQSRQIEVKLTQQNEKSGVMLVRNTTQQPITVEFPAAFVGVHITNANLAARGQAPQSNGQTAQSTGVSISGAPARLAADAPVPDKLDETQPNAKEVSKPGQFKIPAGKTVRFPVTSVCLEYGKPEPHAKLPYLIIPVERYSRNPVLHELLPLFAKARVSQKVAQAAAWHVSNGLTWRELAGIMGQGPVPVPMFDTRTLQQANVLVNEAAAIAVKRRNSRTQKPPQPKPREQPGRTEKPRSEE
jgi:hypothetical protein